MTPSEKQLVEATIAAKDQTIVVLSDVIDHLRLLLAERPAAATVPTPLALERIDFDEDVTPTRDHMSEEEEDIQFMFAAGHLTEDQRDAALIKAGVRGPIALVK